jgi:hypothetical protein
MLTPLTLDEIVTVVDDPLAVAHLKEYFGLTTTSGRFSGGRFER